MSVRSIVRSMVGAASVLAMASHALAMSGVDATDPDLTDDQIRIIFDDCAFNSCSEFNFSTGQELADALLAGAAERQSLRNQLKYGAGEDSARAAMKKKDAKQNGQGNALGQQDNSPQVVYLQFGSANPTFNVFVNGDPFVGGVFNDYIYTQADRDFIQARLEADYAQYNYVFTQTLPAQGEFSTLRIGDNDDNPIDLAFGILFGRADNIDFGNDDRGDDAFVDASFWQLLAELDADFGTQNLQNFLGLPAPLDAAGVEVFRQIAVVNQSANTASHELGHIQGLRHHDSFGAPGDGLPPARSPGGFIPVGELDQDALETLQHIMASGASAGLPLNSPPFVDRFFSERSAVKLAVNGRTRVISEESAEGNNGVLELHRLVSPNPLLDGQNADGGLEINSALVAGSIGEFDEVDSFGIRGEAGRVFNAEIISNSDLNIADPIFARLALYLVLPDGSRQQVISNQRTFEGLEPLLFDFTLPETGDYVLEVSSPDLVPLASGALVSLGSFGLNAFRTGDYELHVYIVDGKLGGGPSSLPGPSN